MSLHLAAILGSNEEIIVDFQADVGPIASLLAIGFELLIIAQIAL